MNRPDLTSLIADPEQIAAVPADALPGLIGQVETLRARLWSRLQASSAAPSAKPPRTEGEGIDRLLTTREAADRLAVSKRWLYRNASELPFTRRLSAGTLRFSERGLEKWKNRRSP